MKTQQLGSAGVAVTLLLASLLVVACSENPAPPVAVDTPETVASVAPTAAPLATHVVEKGDRMVDIAARYDIPLGRLIEWNDVPNPDVIEVGQVIFLEDPTTAPEPSVVTPTASGTALPRLVQTEVAKESFNDRFREWWAGAPRVSLSGDAVQQGIFAAIALPSVVLVLFLLWSLVRVTVTGTKRLRGRGTQAALAAAVDQEAGASGTAGDVPAERARRRIGMGWLAPGGRSVGARLRSMFGATVRLGERGARATGRGVRLVASRSAQLLTSGVGFVARTLHLGARRAADARTARRERVRDEEFRRESRRWWSQGRERLRIGLLDEAEECFETGLSLSVEGGWNEEIALYREELRLLEERRKVERSLVPSGTEV